MAHALSLLGYKNVHHTITYPSETTWKYFSRAADATFPTLETHTGSPFSKEDWDSLYGNFEAATEIASVFAPQLIDAYPRAKVILVVRDFDRWFQSVDDTFLVPLWSPLAYFFANIVHPVIGATQITTLRKLLLGFFEAPSPKVARLNARKVFEQHHSRVIQRVPKDQLLIYRMGDGWDPLCKFLEKPIPIQDFPRSNEAADLKKSTGELLISQLKQAVRIVLGLESRRHNV
jgi:hypothetical protein